MRRFTILSLMLVVVALAVGIAALRSASELWAGGVLLFTAGLLGTAIIGSAFGHKRWLGFAVFCGGYLLLAFGKPDLGLPTTQALGYANQRVAAVEEAYLHRLVQLEQESALIADKLAWATRNASTGIAPTVAELRQVLASIRGQKDAALSEKSKPDPWRSFLPGAANRGAFLQTGHSLFALLAGLLGVVIAWRFEKTRVRGREAA